MSPDTTSLGVVFIHGLFSSEKTWDDFARLLETDEKLDFVTVRRFDYSSPLTRRFRPDRRTPDYNDLAERLKTFLHIEAKRHDRVVLVAHSQGGLVVQRYLSRMLNDGQGLALARILGVVLFACPNDGSDFLLPLRDAWWRRHPQVRALAPLDSGVKDAQRTVLRQIVQAQEIGPASCPIPFRVFGGMDDNIVARASAQGVFPDVFMLPGDHFSIIKPKTHEDPAYLALHEHLMEVQQCEGASDPLAPPSGAPTTETMSPPWGDDAKAARILDVLPPYADWLKTLRSQQFYVVSGRVNRLFHEAVDSLRNDPLDFIDSGLQEAAIGCSQAAVALSEAMIELLFADGVDAEAYERLPAPEKEDAWRFVVGEYRRGKRELHLHTLRNSFFEAYDTLLSLINKRLPEPEQAAVLTSPARSAAVVERTAAHHALAPQLRVGQGLPRHERDLRLAYDQLRSAGLGEPITEAYTHGIAAIQRFAAVEGTESGWVLCVVNGRAAAVSDPVWQALLDAGQPASNSDPLDAVGYPTTAGIGPAVIGEDVERLGLEGGSWGPGWLVRSDRGWHWDPQVRLGFDQTRSAMNWTAAQPAPQLRLRVLVTLPWAPAGGMEITPTRRRSLAQALPFSSLAGAATMLSRRRGADLPAAHWQLGPHRNAIDSVSYSATITAVNESPALVAAAMVALPGALQSHTVTCAEITVQDTTAWAAALPPDVSTRLDLDEVEAVLLAAWETAADLLPAAACDVTTMRWAGAPAVELRLSAEAHPGHPRADLATLIDFSVFGSTDRSPLSEMAVTITVSPVLERAERQRLLRTALVHMAQGFGYVEADECLL
ncbi:esterase/lipase family protein [Kitasatospora sp. NPDC056651]|uniref:esterase/lipase family protein n=1 Tax=Kitasatospora sp. NPDC056651 TaxID=3345892 RepID=UPI003693D897